jgi:hypothetical protein
MHHHAWLKTYNFILILLYLSKRVKKKAWCLNIIHLPKKSMCFYCCPHFIKNYPCSWLTLHY